MFSWLEQNGHVDESEDKLSDWLFLAHNPKVFSTVLLK